MLRPFTLVVCIAAGIASPAFGDGKNEIRTVSYDEQGGVTRVHVRGAQTPTFTVYKLERPSRVVIDLPQARLADALRGHDSAAVFTANTWAVSTVAAQQLDDGGAIVRVIVTLARPGRYDVKTEGQEVVVMVTPRDAAPNTASADELAAAQAEAVKAKQEADRLRAEVELARKQNKSDSELAQVKKRADDAARVAAAAQAEVDRARAETATAKAEVAKASAEVERLRAVAAEQTARA